jgi:hypothetical protein
MAKDNLYWRNHSYILLKLNKKVMMKKKAMTMTTKLKKAVIKTRRKLTSS